MNKDNNIFDEYKCIRLFWVTQPLWSEPLTAELKLKQARTMRM